MDEFVKVAEISQINFKASKAITEALENAGFVVCFDSDYTEDPDYLIVMKKRTE